MMDTSENNKQRFSIRLMERQDIEAARLLHNDASTLLQLTNVEHVSEAQQEAWFHAMSTSKTSRRYTVHEAESGAFVGLFRVDHMDLINKSVCVGLDIVPEMRGRGYAKEIFRYFLDYYFMSMGMNRIYLAVLETNTIGRNLYRGLGFVEESVHREAIFRNGGYINLIWMSILRREYAESNGLNLG